MCYMDNDFGENLKLARVNKGYTQEQLANIIGVSKQSVAMYENNKRTPKNEALIKITEALEVSMDFLFGTQNNTPSELNELTKSTNTNSSIGVLNIFIERLRELIGNKKAVEIANEIDISPSTLSLYLSGKRVPHLEVIVKLCKYFNVSSDYLLDLTDEPNAKGEVPMDYQELKEKAEILEKLKETIKSANDLIEGL